MSDYQFQVLICFLFSKLLITSLLSGEAAGEVSDIFSDVSKQEIDDDNEHDEYSCDDSDDDDESLDGNQKIDLKKLVKKGKQLQGHTSGPSLRTVC